MSSKKRNPLEECSYIELFLVEMQEFMTSIIDIIIQASRFSVEKCSNNPQELTKLLKLPGRKHSMFLHTVIDSCIDMDGLDF